MKFKKPDQPRRRSFSAVAVAGALAAAFMPCEAFAHEDDDLSVIPPGDIGLLPDTNTDPAVNGHVGPLLPMHTMSVHNTVVWKKNSDKPGMLMFHRHSQWRANDMANPEVINFLITNPDPVTGKTALGDPANQFNSSIRRAFVQIAYGGYTIIHDVSQSVPTRIRVDQTRELTQLWDMGHPHAFKYNYLSPKYSAAALNNSDAEMNLAAFKDMGYSRGLYYDMYCPGFATLADGRPVFPGGHDLNSQNGMYRIQVFDPDREQWLARPESCMRAAWGKDPNDPFMEKFFAAQRELIPETSIYWTNGNSLLADCNPHLVDPNSYSLTYPKIRLMGTNGTVTQPGRIASDMRYARWYPTAVALPNNMIFIFAGWDRDESVLPNPGTPSPTTLRLQPFLTNAAFAGKIPTNWTLSGNLTAGGNTEFLGTRVKIPVPEVYDGTTDQTFTLENARLFHSAWYPNGLVVQTGPGEADWRVAALDGELFENIADGELGNTRDRDFNKTWLYDVQGALNDTNRNVPSARAGKFVRYLSASPTSHSPFSANANLVELDTRGRVLSHRLYHFGGNNMTNGQASDAAEMIDFAGLSKKPRTGEPLPEMPKWVSLPGKLYQRARQNYATPLPDGTILILGGNGGTLPGIEAWSLHLQLFDPKTGTIRKLAKSLMPRDEHGIIQLLPDGTVYLGGQNRNGQVRAGDPIAPQGDPDLGVPSGQIYKPPYLFDYQGNPADRPKIYSAPKTVTYGRDFNLGVYGADDVSSVVMIRSGSMSHSLNTDVRYVKLPFTQIGENSLRVTAPVLPGTAVGGNYMLYVINGDGVPSLSKRVIVGPYIAARR